MRLVKKPAFVFFLTLLLSVATGCAYIETKQNALIFHPALTEWKGRGIAPEGMQEHWINVGNANEKIHAWWVPHPTHTVDKPAPVLLYLHGASVSIGVAASRIPRWNKMGFSVLAIDYRGFGQSSKISPTEETATEDAKAAWEYIHTIAPQSRRFIYGHSLGGAMASRLALQHPEAHGLILESTFTSIPDMVPHAPWWLRPFGFLVTQRFDVLDRIGKLNMPVLIAHGTADTTVPYAMSERLYAAAAEPKRLLKVEGGSHRNLTLIAFDAYRDAVHALFGIGTSNPALTQAEILNNAKS